MGFGGPHSRVIPCEMCGEMFFPASLKFHMKACVLKQASVEMPCPTCEKVFLRYNASQTVHRSVNALTHPHVQPIHPFIAWCVHRLTTAGTL
jgi:hypothetical protein